MNIDQEDKQLLENVFDSLDRLFDRESKVIDVYQLLYATAIAIGHKYSGISLSDYGVELQNIVKTGVPEEAQREEALKATDALRKLLNDVL